MTALTKICPPPAPLPSAPDWSRVETDLGMRLPQDYRQLMATYGPGEFCNFLSLYYPHAPRAGADLTGPMPARLRQQIVEVRHNARQSWPLPHPPEQLFAMGVTGNGDHLFWVTQPSNKPDGWDVAVNQALRAPCYTFTGTLTEFLLAVVGGRRTSPSFPKTSSTTGLRSPPPAQPLSRPPQPTIRAP